MFFRIFYPCELHNRRFIHFPELYINRKKPELTCRYTVFEQLSCAATAAAVCRKLCSAIMHNVYARPAVIYRSALQQRKYRSYRGAIVKILFDYILEKSLRRDLNSESRRKF